MRWLTKSSAVLAVGFVYGFALRYLLPSASTFGIYEARYAWLLAHIFGGTAALLIGPAQFWLALNGNYRIWHRILGIGYVMSVAISSAAAVYLAVNTDFGWVFGAGMMTLALVWMTTTGLAVTAICRYLIDQHKEWMIRSYVVTFAFVIFRLIVEVSGAAGIGTITERFALGSWLCWSVPLLITESVLQVRKM